MDLEAPNSRRAQLSERQLKLEIELLNITLALVKVENLRHLQNQETVRYLQYQETLRHLQQQETKRLYQQALTARTKDREETKRHKEFQKTERIRYQSLGAYLHEYSP